jgi:hypothetical protein
MLRRIWLALPFLLMGLTATSPSSAGITVQIGPPPPPKVVSPPPPKRGYVWVPGYYDWDGRDYVWKEGHWEAERTGYTYREPRWVQRSSTSWELEPGGWESGPPSGPPPPPP